MRKAIAVLTMLTGCMMMLTGCANTIPELDEQSKDLVVEYAAATVRKYNDYQPGKLLDESKTEAESVEGTEEAVTDAEPDAEADVDENVQTESTLIPDEAVPVIEKDENETFIPATINDFLNLEGVHISYEGYEVKDSYPDAGDELFFIMEATKGNKLLLLKFAAYNDSAQECSLDFAGKDIRYKIAVNGKTKNALATMLPDDLRNYQGVIAAGEKVMLVLVREINEEQAENIGELAITLKDGDKNATISLN